jgi:putative MATE family efflux protein
MSQTAPAQPASLDYTAAALAVAAPEPEPRRVLLRQLLWLALPILVEQVLHMLVGLTDVYIAGHLRQNKAAATAAVGSVAYILWLIGLIAGTIGTGSTALVARAVGARHRSLANSVCGQTVTAAVVTGVTLALLVVVGARLLAALTGLEGESHRYALFYLRALSLSLPFMIFMFAANACLRGAGDTVTPAVSMVVVDALNMALSFSLARGLYGLPELGFRGIAVGTVSAYVVGGLLQFAVLLQGRGGLKLHLHRLRPHWHTLRRILRIGLPSGVENLVAWSANFVIVAIINRMDPTNVAGSAHIVTIRMESISFLVGFAFATAAATMVGQSLGMGDPARARRSAYLAYLMGGGVMGVMGALFVTLPRVFAGVLTNDPAVIALTARCLFITGFAQLGFASYMVFSLSLRGAGDTFKVMLINLASVLCLRLGGVLVVTLVFGLGLPAIWVVLAAELMIRGTAMFARFLHGAWRHVKV